MSAYPLAPEVPPQSAAARRVGFDRTATNVGQYTAAAGSSKFGPIRDQMTPAASTVYTQGSPPGPFATTSMTHDIIYVQPQGADSVEDAGAVLREGNVTQFILPHQGIVRNCFLCLPMADWTNGLVASIPTAYQKSMEDAMGYSGKPSSGNKAVRSWGFGDAPKFDQRQTSGSAAHKSSAYALTTLRVAFNDGMKDNYTSIDSVATTQSLTVGQTFKESDPATGLQRDKPYYFTSLYAPPVQGSAASKNTNEVQPLVSADTAIDGGVLRAGSFTGVPAIVHSQLMKLRSKTPDERMQISFDVENEGVAKSSQVLHDVEEFGFVQLEPADGTKDHKVLVFTLPDERYIIAPISVAVGSGVWTVTGNAADMPMVGSKLVDTLAPFADGAEVAPVVTRPRRAVASVDMYDAPLKPLPGITDMSGRQLPSITAAAGVTGTGSAKLRSDSVVAEVAAVVTYQTLFSQKAAYGLSTMTSEQSFALYKATGGKFYASSAALATAVTAGTVLGSPAVFQLDHPLRVNDAAGMYGWSAATTRDASELTACRVYEQCVLRSATNETSSKFYRIGSKVTPPGMLEEITVDASMINGILFHDPVRPSKQALDDMELRQSRIVKSELLGGVKQEVSFIDMHNDVDSATKIETQAHFATLESDDSTISATKICAPDGGLQHFQRMSNSESASYQKTTESNVKIDDVTMDMSKKKMCFNLEENVTTGEVRIKGNQLSAMSGSDLVDMNNALYNYSMTVNQGSGRQQLPAGPKSWYWTGGKQLKTAGFLATGDEGAVSGHGGPANKLLGNAETEDAAGYAKRSVLSDETGTFKQHKRAPPRPINTQITFRVTGGAPTTADMAILVTKTGAVNGAEGPAPPLDVMVQRSLPAFVGGIGIGNVDVHFIAESANGVDYVANIEPSTAADSALFREEIDTATAQLTAITIDGSSLTLYDTNVLDIAAGVDGVDDLVFMCGPVQVYSAPTVGFCTAAIADKIYGMAPLTAALADTQARDFIPGCDPDGSDVVIKGGTWQSMAGAAWNGGSDYAGGSTSSDFMSLVKGTDVETTNFRSAHNLATRGYPKPHFKTVSKAAVQQRLAAYDHGNDASSDWLTTVGYGSNAYQEESTARIVAPGEVTAREAVATRPQVLPSMVSNDDAYSQFRLAFPNQTARGTTATGVADCVVRQYVEGADYSVMTDTSMVVPHVFTGIQFKATGNNFGGKKIDAGPPAAFYPGMTEAQLSADKSAWETQDNTESGAVLSAFNCDVGGLTPWDTSSCQWGVVNSESKVAEEEGKFLDGYRSRDLGSGHKELRHSVTDESIDMWPAFLGDSGSQSYDLKADASKNYAPGEAFSRWIDPQQVANKAFATNLYTSAPSTASGGSALGIKWLDNSTAAANVGGCVQGLAQKASIDADSTRSGTAIASQVWYCPSKQDWDMDCLHKSQAGVTAGFVADRSVTRRNQGSVNGLAYQRLTRAASKWGTSVGPVTDGTTTAVATSVDYGLTAAPLLLAETDGVGRAGSFTGVPAIVHSQLMKLRSKTPDERMQISFDVENEGVAKSSQVLHDVEEFGFVQLEPADGHALQVRKERNVRRENRPTSDASTVRHPQPPRNRENRQNRTVDARRNSSSSSAPSSGSRRATSRRPQPPRSRENRQTRTPRPLVIRSRPGTAKIDKIGQSMPGETPPAAPRRRADPDALRAVAHNRPGAAKIDKIGRLDGSNHRHCRPERRRPAKLLPRPPLPSSCAVSATEYPLGRVSLRYQPRVRLALNETQFIPRPRRPRAGSNSRPSPLQYLHARGRRLDFPAASCHPTSAPSWR